MKILADENIALVQEAFGSFGELHTMPGRSISAEHLRDVDALLVRSVTRVNSKLLENSSCRFVGTATSGIDHIDTVWLQQQGVRFAQALGSNANSVVDYVFAACALLSEQSGQDWRTLSTGIIGCGEVGGRFARRLQALGMPFKIYDPLLPVTHPLAEFFTDLPAVLQQDLVTIHTPLTHSGSFPTYHMLDASRLAQLQPQSILVNAARGEVIDGAALLARLIKYPASRVVLDAWEGEPNVCSGLLAKVSISTPHIAGYSRQGKLNGTAMIQQAFCECFGLQPLPDIFTAATTDLQVSAVAEQELHLLNHLLLSAYDLDKDHRAMQDLLGTHNTAENFDSLRRNYPERREFSQCRVNGSQLPESVVAALVGLGFKLA